MTTPARNSSSGQFVSGTTKKKSRGPKKTKGPSGRIHTKDGFDSCVSKVAAKDKTHGGTDGARNICNATREGRRRVRTH